MDGLAAAVNADPGSVLRERSSRIERYGASASTSTRLRQSRTDFAFEAGQRDDVPSGHQSSSERRRAHRLANVANWTGGELLYVSESNQIPVVAKELLRMMRHQYLLPSNHPNRRAGTDSR
jgi:hypothetical protein